MFLSMLSALLLLPYCNIRWCYVPSLLEVSVPLFPAQGTFVPWYPILSHACTRSLMCSICAWVFSDMICWWWLCHGIRYWISWHEIQSWSWCAKGILLPWCYSTTHAYVWLVMYFAGALLISGYTGDRLPMVWYPVLDTMLLYCYQTICLQ